MVSSDLQRDRKWKRTPMTADTKNSQNSHKALQLYSSEMTKKSKSSCFRTVCLLIICLFFVSLTHAIMLFSPLSQSLYALFIINQAFFFQNHILSACLSVLIPQPLLFNSPLFPFHLPLLQSKLSSFTCSIFSKKYFTFFTTRIFSFKPPEEMKISPTTSQTIKKTY